MCILKLLNNLRAEICRVQRNTEERGGSDFCCSYVPSHEARARWMNTMHYFGALNTQRGDMLDIWSRSKVLLIRYIGTQLSKCPQQAELCFSSVQNICWGSKKPKPMHNISAPLQSAMRSAFLIGRWTSFGYTPNSFFYQKNKATCLVICGLWDSSHFGVLWLYHLAYIEPQCCKSWLKCSSNYNSCFSWLQCRGALHKKETWSWNARCWSLPCSKAFGLVFGVTWPWMLPSI